jgi:simple sugar transport system ATP-binding protein
MAQMMVGEAIELPERRAATLPGAARLKVRIERLPPKDRLGVELRDLDFTVRAGEIFGIAGVAGNGQGELMDALVGETRSERPDDIEILGQPVGRLGPRRRRGLGAAFVPEERLGEGAVPDLDLAENAYLTGSYSPEMTRYGFLRPAARDAYARGVIERFDVRASGIGAEARSLSGGNLQKFIVGREILKQPELLVIAQPTWGVDAGAAAAIHRALIDLSRGQGGRPGAAILIVSQDLDEILALSDSFAVISDGRLSRPLDPRKASREEIGLLMGGLQGADMEGTGDAAA